MQLNIDPVLLGKRLAEARKARGITQEDAAAKISCSRPTFIAIEKGTRLPKSEELVKLADLYGRSVHTLVRPAESGKVSFELPPHFRAATGHTVISAKELEDVTASYQKFVEDYCELETIHKTPLRKNYPPVLLFSNIRHTDHLAESIAAQERVRLGLGDQPVYDLRNILEREVGLRIFYDDLPSRIAGMFSYNDEVGGVVVVNRKQPPERRRLSIMHEYGHLIRDRYMPGIDYIDQPGNKGAEERFADKFAVSFLMPTSAIQRYFYHVVEQTNDFQIADLFRMAHFFNISLEAIANRLVDMRLINDGVIDHIHRAGKKNRDLKSNLNLSPHENDNQTFSNRYISLAVRAYEEEKISIGQLAGFLRTDKVDARNIVQEYTTCDNNELFCEMMKSSKELVSLLK